MTPLRLVLLSSLLFLLSSAFDTRLKDVPINKCKNGAELRDGVCECGLNFEGELCEKEICENGGRPKKDKFGNVKCECKLFTEGARCERLTQCSQNGVLEDGKCICKKGFAGPTCNAGGCHNGDAVKIPDVGEYECECEVGYTGTFCQEMIVCENGGTVGNDNTCVCKDGFEGELCEECAAPKIVMGGQCVHEVVENAVSSSSIGMSLYEQWHVVAIVIGGILLLVLLIVAALFAVRTYRSKPSRVSSAQGSAIVPHPEGTDV